MAATYCLHGYDWDPVVSRMTEIAEQEDDLFLSTVVHQVSGATTLHAPDGAGCDSCHGIAVELCATWAEAQRTMLAWLIGRVDA